MLGIHMNLKQVITVLALSYVTSASADENPVVHEQNHESVTEQLDISFDH